MYLKISDFLLSYSNFTVANKMPINIFFLF